MEIVGRATVMFLVIYLLLRLMGKRELGQMAPFELVTLIVMGDLIQQGVTHQDFSMTGASLAIITFAFWSLVMNSLSHRVPRLRSLLEGEPVVLVHHGKTIARNMNRERIDDDELAAEMRLAGIARLDQIAWALLEPEGKISFIKRDEGDLDPRVGESGTAG
ncbi:MAG: YetF domain-containing protein [Novosphingobium sp.]